MSPSLYCFSVPRGSYCDWNRPITCPLSADSEMARNPNALSTMKLFSLFVLALQYVRYKYSSINAQHFAFVPPDVTCVTVSLSSSSLRCPMLDVRRMCRKKSKAGGGRGCRAAAAAVAIAANPNFELRTRRGALPPPSPPFADRHRPARRGPPHDDAGPAGATPPWRCAA